MFPNDMALVSGASLLRDLELVAFSKRTWRMIGSPMTVHASRNISAIQFHGPLGVRETSLRMQRL
jgi:hypothetical protein